MDYKKEELKFLNMKKIDLDVVKLRNTSSGEIFEIENELSVDEKIKFIDSQSDGVASYLLELFEKWEADKNELPQNSYGRPKTVSFKAWLRRNDPKNRMSEYDLGTYNLFGTSFIGMGNDCPKANYNYNLPYTGKHVVHQWFHDLCEKLYLEEREYFKSIDPFSIKLKIIKAYGDLYNVTFGNEEIHDIVWNRKEDVAEENLDMYIKAYEKLEATIKDIENELNLK